jgi:hypothetical protein
MITTTMARKLQGLGLGPIDADTPRTTQQAIAACGQAVLMRQAEAPDNSGNDEATEAPCKRKRKDPHKNIGGDRKRLLRAK